MRLHQVSILMCLFAFTVASARGSSVQHGCSPSSCGQLQDIRYPFRLKDDPPKCGDPRFELTCDTNRTVIDYHSGKYYVESISYVNKSIQIIDIGLANRGCSLPFHTLLPDTIYNDELLGNPFRRIIIYGDAPFAPQFSAQFHDFQSQTISCVNCTRNIQNKTYTPIPCLSGNSGFVYVVYDSRVASLAPSCRFLAMVPYMYNVLAHTEERVFENLQKGILLFWSMPSCRSISSVLKECLVGSQREESFDQCVGSAYLSPQCESKHDIIELVETLIGVLFLIPLGLLFGRLVCVPLTIYAFIAYKYLETRVPADPVEKFLRNQQSLTPIRYTYTDIIVMTKNFKEKLGQGGFGSVYKGELFGGFLVAVKMLGSSRCNGDDFISEVSTIGRIHHINIVRLVGFSSEGSKRALIYEYLPKGSLDKYIFSSSAMLQRPFTWDKLIDIALGVARGIDYLHQGCDMRILHFDIKPHNILLDNCFNPKVSDFGLAKLFPRDYSTVAISAARGTIGYIAPELVSRSFGMISYKSDVYSFGMLLLEMAGGRRNVEPKAEHTSQFYYPSWIYDQLDNKNSEVHEIVHDMTSIGEVERKLSIIGLWCIQTRPSDRPAMSRVIEMLQAEVDTLKMPPKPFLSSETTNSISTMDLSVESSSTALSLISEHESLA